jgi:hypothetical protein
MNLVRYIARDLVSKLVSSGDVSGRGSHMPSLKYKDRGKNNVGIKNNVKYPNIPLGKINFTPQIDLS